MIHANFDIFGVSLLEFLGLVCEMALLKKVGNFLKQSTSNPSLFVAVRSMHTSSKIFIGGLSYSTDDMSLSEAFSKYGDVVEAKVIIDRMTGRSKGFAFVTFTSTEAASSAIQAFDGQELHGRRIKVNYATEKSRSGGFGGGFGSSDGYNYGGPGGNSGGGRFQGGGFGGSSGGNYTGGGGFGSGNQYPSRGDGFSGTDNFSSGGAQGNGNWGGSDSNYYASQSGSSFSSNSETAGPYGNNQGQLGDDHGGIDSKFDDFGQGMDGKDRDDYDESNDYANTRR